MPEAWAIVAHSLAGSVGLSSEHLTPRYASRTPWWLTRGRVASNSRSVLWPSPLDSGRNRFEEVFDIDPGDEDGGTALCFPVFHRDLGYLHFGVSVVPDPGGKIGQ